MNFTQLVETYPHCMFVARALGLANSKRCLLQVATLGGPSYFFESEGESIDEAAAIAADVILFLEQNLSGDAGEWETEQRLSRLREEIHTPL